MYTLLVKISKEQREMLEVLKTHFGITKLTELIRFLIKKNYDGIKDN